MNNIVFHRVEPLEKSAYIKPLRCHFTQNGRPRSWDLVRAHDSVAILLYHKAKDSLVFVRQFRPAVYMNKILSDHQEINEKLFDSYPTSSAFTLEMCAGILDKNKSPKEIAKEEIYEECGFDVPLGKIEKIVKCAGSVGISGTEQTMFYAEVNDEMRTGNGCGNEHEGEMIEVVYYPVSECRKMILDETIVKSTGLMFAVLWFLTDRHLQTSIKTNRYLSILATELALNPDRS